MFGIKELKQKIDRRFEYFQSMDNAHIRTLNDFNDKIEILGKKIARQDEYSKELEDNLRKYNMAVVNLSGTISGVNDRFNALVKSFNLEPFVVEKHYDFRKIKKTGV